MEELRIRQSSIGSFLRCRRKWSFEYLESLELKRDPNDPHPHFALGTVLHSAIEAYWMDSADPMDVVTQVERDVVAAANENDQMLGPEWVKTFQLLRAMVTGYVQWAEFGEFANIEVVACEQEVEWHIGEMNGFDVYVTGIVDRIEKERFTGAYSVVDIKSTAQFMRSNSHSQQLLTYAVLVQEALGITADTILTEQIRKVLRTGTAKPPFYQRIESYVNPQMIQAQRQHLLDIVWDMTRLAAMYSDMQTTLSLYPNRTKDCSWQCDFLAPCQALDDGSSYEYIINNIYRKKESV